MTPASSQVSAYFFIYLIWKKLDGNVVLFQSKPQEQHILCVTGIILGHSNHFVILEDGLQLSRQQFHQATLLCKAKE